MEEEFIEYLKSIDMTKTLIKRIENFYEIYCEICSENIKDIFVSEYIDKSGSRQYEDLRFFSSNFFMVSVDFITKNEFRMGSKQRLSFFRIEKDNYNFKKGTVDSRLYIYIRYRDGTFTNMKASRENCDKLRYIFFKYYKPLVAAFKE